MILQGILKKLGGMKVQIVVGKQPFGSFNSTLLPSSINAALNNSETPIEVLFHTKDHKNIVQDADGKYLIWYPGEQEPALPQQRPTTQQAVQSQSHAASRNGQRNNQHGPRQLRKHAAQQPESAIPHNMDEITERRNRVNKIEELSINFHPDLTVKIAGQDQQVTTRKNTHFQATDPVLAFRNGTIFSKASGGENPGLAITKFAMDNDLPTDIRGTEINSIDRNPYNFVSFAGEKPWFYKPEHPHHEEWMPDHNSGMIEYTAIAKTPLFIPEGFPFSPTGNGETDEALRTMPRHFCRMKKADGNTCYAVPGASIKGALRAGFEALSNSRMGALNEKYYEKAIPYRRRCFNNMRLSEIQTGLVDSKDAKGNYNVIKIKETYIEKASLALFKSMWGGGQLPTTSFTFNETQRKGRFLAIPGSGFSAVPADIKPYKANLMNEENDNHKYSHRIITKLNQTLILEKITVDKYHSNLNHPHYETHWKEYLKNPPADPGQNKPKYTKTKPQFSDVKKDLHLAEGDIIYLTYDGTKITSFGKNVNYLWPAEYAIHDLAKEYFLPDQLGLGMPLSMAERLFGFAANHKKKNGKTISHPFRSRLRFETLWGPAIDVGEDNWTENVQSDKAGFKVKLAPLTSPQARAKARPLYLEPLPANGGEAPLSASYSDGNPNNSNPKPKMRGRKFYWHQKSNDQNGIWAIHKRHSYHDLVEKQLPPEIYPLKTETEFKGRIHFENLTREELGALLFSLAGDETYKHGIKLGKGKPRGLGSVSIKISKLSFLNPAQRYDTLKKSDDSKSGYTDHEGEALKKEIETRIIIFKTWCESKNNNQKFEEQDHIKDYKNLHNLPTAETSRYYPLNFRQYSWLPTENKHPDEPKSPAKRPRAMKRAREF